MQHGQAGFFPAATASAISESDGGGGNGSLPDSSNSSDNPFQPLEDMADSFSDVLDEWATPSHSDIPFSPSLSALLSAFTEQDACGSDTERWRVCAQELKSYPRAFAEAGENAFIHRLLYRDMAPAPIRKAFMVSAAYMLKTQANEAMLFQTIESEVRDLMQSTLITIEDQLAFVQALLVYQIIRLFDGDIRQRVIAEQHLELLKQSTVQLQMAYDIQEAASSPSSRRWVLDESIRRTVLTSYLVLGVYSMIKEGFCDYVDTIVRLPYSSRPLEWESPSPPQSTSTATPDVIPLRAFDDKWESGNMGPVTSLEKTLLVACSGVDRFEERAVNQIAQGC